MVKSKKINVQGTEIVVFTEKDDEYISLTDIAWYRDTVRSDYISSKLDA